jgi:hypothetical protein
MAGTIDDRGMDTLVLARLVNAILCLGTGKPGSLPASVDVRCRQTGPLPGVGPHAEAVTYSQRGGLSARLSCQCPVKEESLLAARYANRVFSHDIPMG